MARIIDITGKLTNEKPVIRISRICGFAKTAKQNIYLKTAEGLVPLTAYYKTRTGFLPLMYMGAKNSAM